MGVSGSLAEELYSANKVRNIVLFFKNVDPRQLDDPGTQLQAVLAFKKRIEEGKRYLFKQYDTLDQFTEALDGHLAKWLRDHQSVPRVRRALSRQVALLQLGQR